MVFIFILIFFNKAFFDTEFDKLYIAYKQTSILLHFTKPLNTEMSLMSECKYNSVYHLQIGILEARRGRPC